MKKVVQNNKGFSLVELLAVIAIMAVLIVAALPYVAGYESWARATAQQRDAQTVATAIARWVSIGADTTGSGNPAGQRSLYAWTAGVGHNQIGYQGAWTSGSAPAKIVQDLIKGWTVVPLSGNRDPFLSPNTAFTQLGLRIRVAFTNARNWTVTGRTNNGLY